MSTTTGSLRASVAGIEFDLIDAASVLELIVAWRNDHAREYITLNNAHAVMQCHRDPAMKAAVQQGALSLPDGMGIVLAATLLSHPHHGRVSGADLMSHICSHGREFGLRHYFYGGAEGVAGRVAGIMQRRYPGLSVAGIITPPFRQLTPEEDAAVVELVNAALPDVLWVGLGAPKQEVWMAAHAGSIRAAAMVGVGAAFDFHAGTKSRAPVWMQRAGLEWVYRSCQERRVLKRNLDIAPFLARVLTNAFLLRIAE